MNPFRRIINFYLASFKGLSYEIWLLTLISLINRAGTMVLPFLSIYLTAELDFSYEKAGIALSIFGVGSFFGSYIGGILADKIGYYQIMFLSLLTGGLMFFFFLYFFSFTAICLIVFFASFFGEAYRPAMMASIAIYSTEKNRVRSIALIRLAINLGYAVGPAVGGIIAYNMGYESLFIIDAVTCVAAAFLMMLTLKERTKTAQKNQVTPTSTEPPPYKNLTFLAFLFGLMICGLFFMQLFYTAPVYYKEVLHLNENTIGALLALNAILVAAVEMPIIHGLEGKIAEYKMIVLGCFFVGLSYFILSINATIIVAIVYIIVVSFGEIFNFPYSSQLIMEISHKRRAEYLSYYSMSFAIGHMIAPLMGLKMAEAYGFTTLWLFAGIMCMGATVILYFTSKKLVTQKVI